MGFHRTNQFATPNQHEVQIVSSLAQDGRHLKRGRGPEPDHRRDGDQRHDDQDTGADEYGRVPAAELEEATLAVARRLASGPPVAYRYMKENFNRAAMGAEVLECLDLEATHHVHTGLTEDHKDAARAFVEKRSPFFKGR